MNKKATRFLCMVIMTMSICFGITMISAYAEDVYTYTINDGEVTITGYTGSDTVLVLPAELEGCPVTAIGDQAFYNKFKVTSITLPSTLESIGKEAFCECNGLSISGLPESVTSMGEGCFQNCYGITSFTVPAGVKELPDNCFCGSYKMTSVTLPEGLTRIGAAAFKECNNLAISGLPESVTSMGEGCFQNCYGITSFTVPAGVKEVPDNCFFNAYNMTSVTLPEGLTRIGAAAFKECNKLASCGLPASVISIGEGCFQKCLALVGATLPKKLTEIPANCFYDCEKLSSITFPDGLLTVGASAFVGCYALTEITLPDSVTDIGKSSFQNCRNIGTVVLSEDLKTIGNDAFSGCDKIKELYLQQNLKSIGDNAFYDVDGIDNIYIRDMKNYDEVIQFGSGLSRPTEMVRPARHEVLCLAKESFDDLSFTYDGTEHIIKPVCPKISADAYTWEELKVTDAGTYEIKVEAKDPKYCYGERTISFKVNRKEMTEADVTISGMEDKVYTGDAIKQTISISENGNDLVEGSDYKLYYDDNVSVGEAKVTISFLGNYKGSIEKTFKISDKVLDLANVKFDSLGFEYDGKSHQIIPVTAALSTSAYTWDLKKVTNPGKYTVNITAKNTAVCSGSKKITFTVARKELASVDVNLTGISDKVYTGKPQKQKLTITLNGTELKNGTDYKVYYDSNVNAGTARLNVFFIGKYTGNVEKTFRIKQAKGSSLQASIKKTRVHTGKYLKPRVTVFRKDGTTLDKSQYTVKYSNNKAVGKAKAVITFKGNYKGTKTLYFTIRPATSKIEKLGRYKNGFRVVWAKKSYSGYQLRYCTSSSMKNAKKIRIKGTKTTVKKITKCKKKTKYFVQVRTYKVVNGKTYYSKWSGKIYLITRK